ncbi:MAG TPA: AEC family transporter [Sphingobacterium sp.]|nr:AEC family transporter [Sphingobacterium sp.]
MVNFVMIILCVLFGMLFRKYNVVPGDAHKGINAWLIYLALPAVSFKYLPKIDWHAEMLFPVVAMCIVWAGGWIFAKFLSQLKGYRQRTRSTFELASGYSNTSFIGFPLVAAYFGEENLGIAMICDQSSFIILSTAGIISALKAKEQGANAHPKIVLRKLFAFPPLIACILVLSLSPFIDFSMADPLFDMFVATLSPLALFSIGLQMRFQGWQKQFSQISMTVFYKLLVAPLLIFILALSINIKGDIGSVTVLEAGMPTLVSSGIIAEQYGLNTKLINLIIGIGIVIGMLTTAIWQAILKGVFYP